MLARRLRRRSNIETTLDQRLVFAVTDHTSIQGPERSPWHQLLWSDLYITYIVLTDYNKLRYWNTKGDTEVTHNRKFLYTFENPSLYKRRLNVGPMSQTLAQHWATTSWRSRVRATTTVDLAVRRGDMWETAMSPWAMIQDVYIMYYTLSLRVLVTRRPNLDKYSALAQGRTNIK